MRGQRASALHATDHWEGPLGSHGLSMAVSDTYRSMRARMGNTRHICFVNTHIVAGRGRYDELERGSDDFALEMGFVLAGR